MSGRKASSLCKRKNILAFSNFGYLLLAHNFSNVTFSFETKSVKNTLFTSDFRRNGLLIKETVSQMTKIEKSTCTYPIYQSLSSNKISFYKIVTLSIFKCWNISDVKYEKKERKRKER